MKVYKGSEELWDALAAGKKLCLNYPEQHNCLYYRQVGIQDGRTLYEQKFGKIVYIYANSQMNRFMVHLENGENVDHNIDLWDIHVSPWVEYEEWFVEKGNKEVKEVTLEEIEAKFGSKIRIVSKKS